MPADWCALSHDKALEGCRWLHVHLRRDRYKRSAPAESLDEVKTQAIDDFKLIAAYEKLKADQTEYLDKAAARRN